MPLVYSVKIRFVCLFELILYIPVNFFCSCWHFLGMTIVAKNDYCDSIDIAGSAIAILLLLWTTIAIQLSGTFMLV